MCRIVMCGLAGSTIFLYIVSYTARFWKKRELNMKCVLLLSTNLCEIFLILRRIQRNVITNVYTFLCKVLINPVIF
jgi:hypothetical protein